MCLVKCANSSRELEGICKTCPWTPGLRCQQFQIWEHTRTEQHSQKHSPQTGTFPRIQADSPPAHPQEEAPGSPLRGW